MCSNQKMKELETSTAPVNMVTSNGGSTILARPLMAMDGNLLSAFWNKGACIPDKLVDKTDVLNELIDEILMSMKMKSSVVSFFFKFIFENLKSENKYQRIVMYQK